MRTTDLIFSGIYLAVLLIAFTQVSALSEIRSASVTSAKLFPQLVLGLGLLVGVIEAIRTLLQRVPDDAPSFRTIWAHTFRQRRMMLLGLFVIYLFAIKPLGFLVATGLFCFVATFVLAPSRGPTTALIGLCVSLCTLALIYVLLVIYLQAFLP